jgi:hypothetical protein
MNFLIKSLQGSRKFSILLFILCFQGASSYAAEHCADQYYIDVTLPNESRWDMCWEHRDREGIVLHHVYYTPKDGNRELILYQASIAQIFVPYNDNGARYHDVSDYGIGGSYMLDLKAEDCPGGSLLSFSGKNVICQQTQKKNFAHHTGSDSIQGDALSILSVSGVGAYYYIPQWLFHDNGTIEPVMGATGSLQRFAGSSETHHGWPINQNRVGLAHLHNYYWRLDFDLGSSRTDDFVEEINHTINFGKRVRSTTRFSSEAAREVNPETMRSWRIVDGVSTNTNGHAKSFEILLQETGHKDKGPSSEPYTFNDFYVTSAKNCEIFASHNPTNNGCKRNLAEFVDGENITNEDIIVWVGVTFYHMPRVEDAPHMDAHWNHFHIIPRDWHAKNPLGNTDPGPGNSAPVITNPGNQVNQVGDEISLTITANDVDGDVLNFTANNLPAGLVIDNATGIISGTLEAAAAGSWDVTVNVSNASETSSVLFNWQVNDDTGESDIIFSDNFESDLGWQVNSGGSDTATTGQWQRADAELTEYRGSAIQLGDSHSGNFHLVTEARSGGSLGTADIDSGVTSIISPAIAIPATGEYELSLFYYFSHLSNGNTDDFLKITVKGDNNQLVILNKKGNGSLVAGNWTQIIQSLSSFSGQNVRILIESADGGSPSLIESGLDDIEIKKVDGNGNQAPQIVNPGNQTNITGETVNLTIHATDADGDSLTYTAVGLPAGLSINNGGIISGTIPANAVGSYNVIVTVSDSVTSSNTSFIWNIEDDNSNIDPVVFRDDFETDRGWTVNQNGSDTATRGQWERGNAEETIYRGTVLQLGDSVSGSNHLVTGRLAGRYVGRHDIDSGKTSIISPEITLPANGEYELSFSYYFAHLYNSSTDDFLRVTIVSPNNTQVVLTKNGSDETWPGSWESFSTSLSSFAGQTIRILIEASDAANPSLVEAGVDNVLIKRN